MRRFTPACLAAASALAAISADAPRPRYGGTLRVEIARRPSAAAPSAGATITVDEAATNRLDTLVFETLVTLDGGRTGPSLATAWDADRSSTRWRFTIRRDVRLHDNSLLTVQDVAAALSGAGHPWKVTAESDAIAIATERPTPDLLWELADARQAIGIARGDRIVGSGPFAIDAIDRTAGRTRLTLRAHDSHWSGRPFVDAILVDAGRRLTDRVSDLEQGRADIVGVGPEDARRLAQRGFTIAASRPVELVAIVRQPNSTHAVDDRTRRALSLAIDRRAMTDVLLQRLGEPAPGVLPRWLAGYTALFEPAHDRGSARAIVSSLPPDQRGLTLRFDPSDPLSRSLAERIVLDAREAGLAVALDAEPASLRPFDFRIARIRMDAASPARAAARVRPIVPAPIRRLLPDDPDPDGSLEIVQRFERAVLDQHLVIPLVHVPDVYGTSAAVESWSGAVVTPSFALDLANIWIRSTR